MADLERRLQTLHRAVRACWDTPGRRGRVISLAGAGDVLVAGDLHGNLNNLRRLLDLADLTGQPGRHLVVQEVLHGPFRYPAGSDRSHQLVDLVAALKVQFPERVHLLVGNHELAQATGRRIAKESGVLNDLFRASLVEAYGDGADAVYAGYLELFAAAPLALCTSNGVLLTHSLPPAPRLACFNPSVLEQDTAAEVEFHPGGSIYSLVWGRDISLEAAAGFLNVMGARLLITGHIACDRGFDFPNKRQIILDSLGDPAGYCLFPTDRPLSYEELVACVSTL